MSTTIKGTPMSQIRNQTKSILYNPGQAALGVDVIPFSQEDVIPTKLVCENGRPLVHKVHNINLQSTKVWVGHFYPKDNSWMTYQDRQGSEDGSIIELSSENYGSEGSGVEVDCGS